MSTRFIFIDHSFTDDFIEAELLQGRKPVFLALDHKTDMKRKKLLSREPIFSWIALYQMTAHFPGAV
jgi:hypothetical protein